MEITALEAVQRISECDRITFLTGAGVSTPSGVPDYRSLKGVYHGYDQPEYLLSHTCLIREPDKFYTFVKKLYHPEAKPNVIHEVMGHLAGAEIVTQNIDGLHQQVNADNCLGFHGSLSNVYCQKCLKTVSVAEYLKSDCHKGCGGQLRPNIILYEEALPQERLTRTTQVIGAAKMIVVVGTSLQVYPFAGLLQARNPQSTVMVINMDRPNYPLSEDFLTHYGPAEEVFAQIKIK